MVLLTLEHDGIHPFGEFHQVWEVDFGETEHVFEDFWDRLSLFGVEIDVNVGL